MDLQVQREDQNLSIIWNDVHMWTVYPDGEIRCVNPKGDGDMPTSFGIDLYHYLALEEAYQQMHLEDVPKTMLNQHSRNTGRALVMLPTENQI